MDDTKKLVERIVHGDRGAWSSLQAALEPTIFQMARRHRGLRRRGLADQPDDLAEVRTAVLERLAHEDFRNLRTFTDRSARADAQSPESFDAWLYGVVDFAIREHLRKRYGRSPKLSSEQAPRLQPSKRDLQSYAGRFDEHSERDLFTAVGVTTRMNLAEIVAYIASSFTPDEATAIQLYYFEGRGFDEIAQQLQLSDAKAADQLIRRLNARLRYRFAPTTEGA